MFCARRVEPAPSGARWSLAARLTAWYVVSSLVLLIGSTGFLYWALVTNLDREDDQFLSDKLAGLADAVRDRPDPGPALRRAVDGERPGHQSVAVMVRVLTPDGSVLAEAPAMPPALTPELFPLPGSDRAPTASELELPDGRAFRLAAAAFPARLPGGASGQFVVQLAFDRGFEVQLLGHYRANLWCVLVIAVIACAVTGHRIASGGMRRLDAIVRTAERVHSSTLDRRIEVAGLPLELARLGVTFNAMLDRLKTSFGNLRQFSADIAHELRTPVNNLRGAVEVALGQPRTADEYRDVLVSVLEESGRLAHLIDSLLFLARTENPSASLLCREEVDLTRELERLREFYEPAAGEAGVTLTCAGDPLPPCPLDRALVHRAVGNLIENSLKNTDRGGRIVLSAGLDGGAFVLKVTDTGHGIAPRHLPHVFERLYRADPSRSAGSGGLGLGLAIVKRIATLHQGTVSITSTEGQGTEVTLRLSRTAGAGNAPV